MAQCYSNTCSSNRSRNAGRSAFTFPFLLVGETHQRIRLEDLQALKNAIVQEGDRRRQHSKLSVPAINANLADNLHARMSDLIKMKDDINLLVESDDTLAVANQDLITTDAPDPDGSGITIAGYLQELMEKLTALRRDCICNGDCGANLMCSCHSNCSSNCSDY